MKQALCTMAVTGDNLVEIRDRTRTVAELFGLDKLDGTRFITAVSEIARNAAQHAGQGTLGFFLEDEDGAAPQQVVAEIADRGPGIADLDAALAGRSSGGRAGGKGLASSRRLANRFSVAQRPGGGTVVTLAMARARGARPLSPAEITMLLSLLDRRKPRSPLEEVQQQNQEMLQLLQTLRERQQELQLADERKNQFVATLAHELRNPLGTLQMTLYILRHKPEFQAPELVAHLAVASRQAQQLNRLVTDLMDVSRVSQGKVELHRRPTDLNEVASQAVEMTGSAIHAKEHQVHMALSAEPVWVDVDSTRMKQVLSNILHNAARYSPQYGRITISIRHSATHAEVVIADEGTGIPADLLPHVFGLFVQGSHQSGSGLGVGLALAQRLVHEHGGTIAAASEGVGRGSQFTVTLPLCPAPARTDRQAPLAATPQDEAPFDAASQSTAGPL